MRMVYDDKFTSAIMPFAAGHRAYVFKGRDSRVDVFRRLLMQVYSDSRSREPAKITVVLFSSVIEGFEHSAQFRSMLASVTDPNLIVLSDDAQSAANESVLISTRGELIPFEASDEDTGLAVCGIEAESRWTMRLVEDATSFFSIGSDDQHEPLAVPRAEQDAASLHEAKQLLRALLLVPKPTIKAATNYDIDPTSVVIQKGTRRLNLRKTAIAAVSASLIGFLLAHLDIEQTPHKFRTRPAADRYDIAELMDLRHPLPAPSLDVTRAKPLQAGAKITHEARLAMKTKPESRLAAMRVTEPSLRGDHPSIELALSLPPDATVAVHLTGKALTEALAKDRIATRKLNDIELARSTPDPQ